MAEFKYFSSCYHCKPPKRHPGCHATCPGYAEDKKNYEIVKENEDYERKMNAAMDTPGFYQTLRRKRKRNRERK